MATPTIAKLFVNASGWNVLPSCPLRANTGMNDSKMIITEKKIGRPTVRQAGITSSRMSPVTFSLPKLGRQVVRGVLDHHDRLVHEDADRDGDARERHDVRGHPHQPHEDEGDQQRPWEA